MAIKPVLPITKPVIPPPPPPPLPPEPAGVIGYPSTQIKEGTVPTTPETLPPMPTGGITNEYLLELAKQLGIKTLVKETVPAKATRPATPTPGANLVLSGNPPALRTDAEILTTIFGGAEIPGAPRRVPSTYSFQVEPTTGAEQMYLTNTFGPAIRQVDPSEVPEEFRGEGRVFKDSYNNIFSVVGGKLKAYIPTGSEEVWSTGERFTPQYWEIDLSSPDKTIAVGESLHQFALNRGLSPVLSIIGGMSTEVLNTYQTAFMQEHNAAVQAGTPEEALPSFPEWFMSRPEFVPPEAKIEQVRIKNKYPERGYSVTKMARGEQFFRNAVSGEAGQARIEAEVLLFSAMQQGYGPDYPANEADNFMNTLVGNYGASVVEAAADVTKVMKGGDYSWQGNPEAIEQLPIGRLAKSYLAWKTAQPEHAYGITDLVRATEGLFPEQYVPGETEAKYAGMGAGMAATETLERGEQLAEYAASKPPVEAPNLERIYERYIRNRFIGSPKATVNYLLGFYETFRDMAQRAGKSVPATQTGAEQAQYEAEAGMYGIDSDLWKVIRGKYPSIIENVSRFGIGMIPEYMIEWAKQELLKHPPAQGEAAFGFLDFLDNLPDEVFKNLIPVNRGEPMEIWEPK